MHEFSLCQNIIQIAETQLASYKANAKANKINKIVLTIGKLAAVDLESLKFWFPVACQDTVLDGVILEIIEPEAEAKCLNCNKHFKLLNLMQACPDCGSYEREILKGQEIMVDQIQLATNLN